MSERFSGETQCYQVFFHYLHVLSHVTVLLYLIDTVTIDIHSHY